VEEDNICTKRKTFGDVHTTNMKKNYEQATNCGIFLEGDGGCRHSAGSTCGIVIQVSVELLGNCGGFNGGFDFLCGSNRCVPHNV